MSHRVQTSFSGEVEGGRWGGGGGDKNRLFLGNFCWISKKTNSIFCYLINERIVYLYRHLERLYKQFCRRGDQMTFALPFESRSLD